MPDETRPLRIAVAGLGFMGKTHLRAWANVQGAELVAIVSSDSTKLSGDLSSTGGNLESGGSQFDFTSLKRLQTLASALADPEIDAIDICLPTYLHGEAASSALRAGKHVLVEKPLALTSPEAYALVAEAETRGLTLMAGHVLRFFPEWQQLATQISTAKIKLGSFRRSCASPSWSPWLTDSTKSGGAALDLLIHDADFVLHCFGEPRSIGAVGRYDPALGIDWISARCSFPVGGPVEITGGWHPSPDYPFSMEFNILTETGTLDWRSSFAAGGRPYTAFGKGAAPVESAFPPGLDPWAKQLQYFSDCARSGATPALCLASESAKAIRFVEMMVESRKRNGETILWTSDPSA